MSRLWFSAAAEARSWASWLGLQPFVGRLLAAQHLGAAAIGLIGVAAVGEGAARDEAALGERALHLILAARGLGGEIGLDPRALVGEADLVQRELLAAHRIDLLGDLGLAGEHVELEVGIGQHREQLAAAGPWRRPRPGPLDPAALDRVEEDGERGLDPGAQRQEIVEPALAHGRDGEPATPARSGCWRRARR